MNVTEGVEGIYLTEEEHRVLLEYFRLSLKKIILRENKFIFGDIQTDMRI